MRKNGKIHIHWPWSQCYQKEKVTVVAPRPVTNNKKRPATQHLILDESQTKKKKKPQDFFRAPSRLSIGILHPVEYDRKQEKEKTSSADAISCVEINFQRFIVHSYSSDCEEDSNNGDSSDVDSIGSVHIITKKDTMEEDDNIKEHIYESIRHILVSEILKNNDNK